MSLFNRVDQRKPLFLLALIAVPFVFVVIGLGAFTRLMDAGLGCPDWPTCYGHILWPTAEHHVEAANLAYSETPVETHKTWPEQVHRLFASALGLISLVVFFVSMRLNADRKLKWQLGSIVGVFLAALVVKIIVKVNMDITAVAMHDIYDIIIGFIVLACFILLGVIAIKRGSSPQPIKLPAFIVGFVILQGLFGMWTVTLKVWPQVVTIHLLGGFTMAALFWLLTLRLNNQYWYLVQPEWVRLKRLMPWIIAGFVIVVAQIALGGWTTSNYAAVACPDFPTCQGQLWPTMDVAQGFNLTQGIGPSYLGGQMDNEARIAIHMAHRIGAIITTVYLLGLVVALLSNLRSGIANSMAYMVLGMLLVQVALGLGNIIFHFPLSVAVAHNAGGALLLLVMLTLVYKAATAKQV